MRLAHVGRFGPGERRRVSVRVEAPAEAGRYVLAVDCVKEGVTWFSEAGPPGPTAEVSVRGE